MYIKIVLPIPVNKHYYYKVPRSLEKKVDIGKRAKVNFNGRITLGYVIECNVPLTGDVKDQELKNVIDIVDEIPLFSEKGLQLALWMAAYYFVSLGEVLKIMTPGSIKSKEYTSFDSAIVHKKIHLTEKQLEILKELKRLSPSRGALIWGITGSGKTEIYLSLMEKFIKKKSRLSI
ncbi:MAG: DEAD/DEAH box helicase family protein [Spirochaetes bacterium]|nr:DEAD/DEAH box helicase family protein [Spirochaetota bacterium]